MRKIFIVVLSIFIISPFFGQNFIRMRSERAQPGDLKISEMSVEVEIAGNIASTTVDFIFSNNLSQILEGELEFPLSEGQYITGYALDINGKMRKGVVVEKEKARVVFEEKVRQGIDPGLVEKTQGNNFKTRVYPLPAKGSRHIQIIYEEELKGNKYILPPLVNDKLDKFDLKCEFFGKEKPSVKLNEGNTLNLDQWNSGYNVKFSRSNYEFTEPLVIMLPDANLTEGLITEDEGRNTYFYYYSKAPAEVFGGAKRPVEKLSVYWDISSSSENRNIEAELKLLKSYIKEHVTSKVSVVLFSNEINGEKTFSASSLKEIEDFIRSAKADGGTSFDCLNFSKENEILLVSDGLGNWGENSIPKASGVVSVISSSVSADYAFLKKIARDNKGSFVNLLNGNSEDLFNENLRLIDVDYDPSVFSEVYPVPGSIVQENFSLSGVLKKKRGVIKLKFGYGRRIVKEVAVEVSAEGDRVIWDTDNKNIVRLWAQKKIDELSIDYDGNRDEILELSKKYGIVTKETSLLVLDSVQDYVRYGIVPPEELLEEYNRLVRNQPKVEKQEGISNAVVNRFNEFKKWWNTKPEDFKKVPKKKQPDGPIYYDMVTSEDGETVAASRPRARLMATNAGAAASEEMVLEEPMLAERSVDNRDTGSSTSGGASINLKAWEPDAEYISVLKRTPSSKMYEKYLSIKGEYKASPSFYMDVADYFKDEGLETEALRILSNLAELNLENTDVLRALGNKLTQWGQSKLAARVFAKMIRLRPEIPLFYRDYALALEKEGRYQEAVDSLYKIATGSWDNRYDEIQQIALNDMNRIIAAHKKEVDTSSIDSRVMENFPVDIRIVLTWNTDDCDIDLWVTDPDDEKCYYGHRLTQIGGRNSRDFTRGYGPEEFCLKSAKKGKYKIQADYYGSSSQKILQPVVVQAEVYTNFGTDKQECQILTLQLEKIKGNYLVGTIEF